MYSALSAVDASHRAPVALEPVAGELVKAGVLLARVELERVRRSPYAATDQRCDLVAPVGCSKVVPAFALGTKRHPVALPVGADPQAVGVLPVALAVALDDCADGRGPAALLGGVPVRWSHAVPPWCDERHDSTLDHAPWIGIIPLALPRGSADRVGA